MKMEPKVHAAAPMPKMTSMLDGRTNFIIYVPTKRPPRKRHMATMLNVCATALLMPRLSAYWIINVHTIICAAT